MNDVDVATLRTEKEKLKNTKESNFLKKFDQLTGGSIAGKKKINKK